MPEPTPGSKQYSLIDRAKAFLDPEGIIFKPRQSDLSSTQFGPGVPIEPSPITPNQAPRRFEYITGTNLIQRPRGEWTTIPLLPFQQLRQLARAYDVASICIETRINWICSAKWSITARDKRRQVELQQLCNQVEKFFKKPNRVTPFPIWLRSLLIDQLEIDALTIFKERDRIGRLIGLRPIDGATIKPLLDEQGDVAAYQQILYGYVRGEYARPGEAPIDPWPIGGDMMYLPRWVSNDSPYGRGPTEQLVIRINTAIRKQLNDLSWYTEGNTPAGFMVPPGEMQPDTVRQFEDAFNADLEGIDRARNKIKFMPWDGKYTPTKPFSYSPEIDERMMEMACASYHIPKNELGMTDKVNKASSQEQEDVAFRHAVGPDTLWLKEVIFDPIISEDLGFPELQFDWVFGKAEDDAAVAATEQADIALGVISADESRRRRYKDLDGKAPGAPQAAPGATPPTNLGKSASILKSSRTTAMVALMVPAKLAQGIESDFYNEIEGPDPEDAADMHITLVMLGDTRDPELAGNFFHLKQALGEISSRMPPIEGVINGMGRFTGDKEDALWLSFDSPHLTQWREDLVETLGAMSVPVAHDHGFVPHITVAYLPKDIPTPDIQIPSVPVTFDRLTLCWGDHRMDWLLEGQLIKKSENTITTETGLVNNNLATPAKRKRRRRGKRTVNVEQLIDSQSAGAVEWAKKVSGGG